MPANRRCQVARRWAVRLVVVGLLSASATGCALADEIRLHFDRGIKKQFKQAEVLDRFAAIAAQSMVFTNAGAWAGFWQKFAIAPPKVDFTTNAAFAVFAGPKPSSGYGVSVETMLFNAQKKRLRIEVLDLEPPPNVGTLSVVTFPYDVVIFTAPAEWATLEVVRRKVRRNSATRRNPPDP